MFISLFHRHASTHFPKATFGIVFTNNHIKKDRDCIPANFCNTIQDAQIVVKNRM
jgi:hypothetical protein